MFQSKFVSLVAISVCLFSAGVAQTKPESSKNLRVISVDVDGGAAVLFVTPEGKSLLIDTGWPPGIGTPRGTPTSAERIAAAAASLGVTKIDYLIMTHYHADHAGGIDALLAKLPVDTFIDHGPNREEILPTTPPGEVAIAPSVFYPKWVAAIRGQHHIVAKVGQKLDIGSMHVEFVTSDGHVPEHPLPGAGQANPLCAGVAPMVADGGAENAWSVGTLITFGGARILELGDLTWNKEVELLCPVNRVGKVDVYFVTGHGMNISSSPPTAALEPLVAIMQNGPMKGGDQEVMKTVRSYPDLKALWLTHYTVRYPDLNGDPDYIANLNVRPDQANFIGFDVTPAGSIVVTNSRNNFSKTYKARAAK